VAFPSSRPSIHIRLSATVEWALLVVGWGALLFLLPHGFAPDDATRFADIERLLHDGELSGSRFSLVMPLVSAPFLLVGEVVQSPVWWAEHFNVIVVGVAAVVALALVHRRGDVALARKTLLALFFASLLTNRLRDYNAEVLTAALVSVGLLILVTGRRAVLGWAAIVVGIVNTPAALVAGALLAAAEAVRTRRLRVLAVPVVATLLIMGEAWLRRGGPLTTGYEGDHGFETVLPYSGKPGFSYPFLFGILVILFSFGRGLLFFTPGLFLWLSSRTRRLAADRRRLVLLMLLFVAGLVLVYAKWWAWYGGVTWGPRFFVFAAVPASLLIAVRLHHARVVGWGNALTLLVLVLSAWVGINGAIADGSRLQFCVRDDFALEALCWYSPEYGGLWQPFVDFPPIDWKSAALVAYCVVVFVYLAGPAVAALARTVAAVPTENWRTGWRF
jgi:hypothetical protein